MTTVNLARAFSQNEATAEEGARIESQFSRNKANEKVGDERIARSSNAPVRDIASVQGALRGGTV